MATHIYVIKIIFQDKSGRICGEMVSVLALGELDHGFESKNMIYFSRATQRGFERRSGETKYYKFGTCCIIKKKEQRLVGSELE